VAEIHNKQSKIHSVCRQCCFFSNMYSTVLVFTFTVYKGLKSWNVLFYREGVHCKMYIAVYIFVAVLWGCGAGGGVCVQKARTNVCVDNNGNPDLHGNMCVNYIPC
jgi:hypothetical protein